MNVIKEIQMLAPKVISNADKIVEGAITNLQSKANLLSESKEEEISRRRILCQNCPFNSINARERNGEYEKLIRSIEERNGVIVSQDIDLSYKTNRNASHCTLCGCDINTKTACLSCTCGAQAFNELNYTAVPVLWEPFNQ